MKKIALFLSFVLLLSVFTACSAENDGFVLKENVKTDFAVKKETDQSIQNFLNACLKAYQDLPDNARPEDKWDYYLYVCEQIKPVQPAIAEMAEIFNQKTTGGNDEEYRYYYANHVSVFTAGIILKDFDCLIGLPDSYAVLEGKKKAESVDPDFADMGFDQAVSAVNAVSKAMYGVTPIEIADKKE